MGHRGLRDVINGAGVSAAACMADWAVQMRFLEPHPNGERVGKTSREAAWPWLVQRLELRLLLRWTLPARQLTLWGGEQLELAGVKKCKAAASSTCHPSQPAAQSFPGRIFTREAAFCLLCSQGRIDDFSQIPKSFSATFPK